MTTFKNCCLPTSGADELIEMQEQDSEEHKTEFNQKIICSASGIGPAPFSIPLHPAGRREKGSLVGQGVAGEVQGGPRNNFRGAECTCDDYFLKEADS
ncbi:hypothetical protein TNCV_2723311 [Trichonephila clavipes]|nr:hypothetical protein TNCV_2723311 [Trichonephila clavipes]